MPHKCQDYPHLQPLIDSTSTSQLFTNETNFPASHRALVNAEVLLGDKNDTWDAAAVASI